MKINFKKIAVLPIAFSLFSNSVLAMNFKDVSQTFWGYQYINDVAQKGLITADAAGYFKPNNNINKFDSAKILAKAAGYKYTDITSDENEFYNNAYNKYKSLLSDYAKKYSKWTNISDREIAYLLEKNIFTQSDLDKFIVKDTSSEKLRALSKEEAAMYLVKLIDTLVQVNSSDTTIFADDSLISESYKPYVACLCKNGIITGDDNNKFNPKSAVTKTTFSVMLSKTLKFIEDNKVQRIESISGTIDKIYTGIGAVQIISSSGSKNVYKISSDASIIIDGSNKTLSDLKENMAITANLNNSVIISIKAENYSPEPDLDPDIKLKNISGIVESTSLDSPKTISIKIQMLNPSGGVITQVLKYVLADNCKINRSDSPISLSDISNGEIVKIGYDDEKAYSITIEEKNKRIIGTLLEKKYNSDSAYLVIEDSNKEKYELKITSDTTINRKNDGRISWNDLKIGDKITASAEYSNLTDVYAEGESATKEGWVEEVKISKDGSAIVKIRNEDNLIKEYYVSAGKVDVYSIHVNNKVKINIDSDEINSLVVIDKSQTNYFGEVQRIYDNTTIKIKTDTGNEIEIQCNKDTKFKDENGRDINISSIYRKDKVYIVMNDNSNYAKSVTIVYSNR
jgi:S-layer homology domain.